MSANDEQLIGLVPAAGLGLRLGLPYPKELYPIIRDNRYKPVAQHVLENLVEAGAEHVVLVINETKHQLLGYFGDGHRFGCRLSYVVQEPATVGRGPSGGLAQALHAGHHLLGERTVLFGMPDTIIEPADALRELRAERFAEADLVLALFRTETPQKFGMVDFAPGGDARPGAVRAIVDKPERTELEWMWGAILWRPRFTAFLDRCLAAGAPTDFAGILNAALEAGLDLRAVPIEGGRYTDVGTWEEIARLDEQHRE